tara:strand:+ start:93 stop:410 length:318 start_codon:yes stop_codon:yes gene_type:complete
MKLTKRQLQRIIQEELEAMLREEQPDYGPWGRIGADVSTGNPYGAQGGKDFWAQHQEYADLAGKAETGDITARDKLTTMPHGKNLLSYISGRNVRDLKKQMGGGN